MKPAPPVTSTRTRVILGGEASLNHAVRRLDRRDSVRVRLGEEPAERIGDSGQAGLDPVGVTALVDELDEVDDAARVDDVVRGEEDVALLQELRVRWLRELVVRGAGDRAAVEERDRLAIENGAHGA